MTKKSSILKFEIISAIFMLVVGTLLHFTFGWSNNNPLIGTFSAVNESTWEHLKLLFFPMLISTIIGYFYKWKVIPNYLCAKVLGIILSMSFIVVFFYTYTGIIGTNFAIVSIIILLVLCLCFFAFTFFPPHIALFKDPITGMFGI